MGQEKDEGAVWKTMICIYGENDRVSITPVSQMFTGASIRERKGSSTRCRPSNGSMSRRHGNGLTRSSHGWNRTHQFLEGK